MNETPHRTANVRTRAATAVLCSVLIAAAGAVLAAPADASPITVGSCPVASPPSSSIIDGRSTGAAGCTSASGTSDAPVTPGAPVVLTEPAASDAAADVPAAPNTLSAARATATDPLASIDLGRSTSTVYPVEDGYLDSVKFSIRALDADGLLVPVEGTAVLSKGSKVVEAWTLDQSASVLTWDGRMADAVRNGVYELVVTAYSSDGTTRTVHSRIRVVSKHVERRAIMVRSNVSTTALHATMPRAVMHAFSNGLVTVRLRTVARVIGPAKLVFSSAGVVRPLTLRNGVHTTAALPIPKGFERVTISHDWARGAAKLTSVTAIWSYSTLVR